MNILDTLKQLRDDIKAWVTINLNALNSKIDEKTIPIDSELSTMSTNPVQNKTITNAINNIPRFSGDYNDLTNAPNITEDESSNMIIADESGNIIFKVDSEGAHTTNLILDGENAATEVYVDNAIANINFPKTDLSGYYTKDETDTAINNLKTEISESIISESTEWTIVDNDGNIISKIDADGLETTNVKAQAIVVNGTDVESKIDELDTHIANTDIHITKTEREFWNSKSEFSGSYDDLTDVPEDLASTDYVNNKIDSITANSLGLGNVDNTSDINKPVSNATQTALNELKTELSESIVSESNEWKVVDNQGNIALNVDANGLQTSKIIADSMILNNQDIIVTIDKKIADLVDSAPEALNTLNELAEALGDNPNFATAISEEIGKKVDKEQGKGLSTNDFTDELKNKLVNFEETDPTVPAWAKEAVKPTYTPEEIGLGNVNNTADLDKPVSNATQTALNNLKTELSESIVSESEEWTVVDNEGNIVLTVDNNGLQTTTVIADNLILNDSQLATEEYVNNAVTNKQDKIIDTLVLADAITGDLYKLQIQNGQLVTFPVTEEV